MAIDKKVWQQALDVQDACNLSGVVYGMKQMMDAVCAEAQELGQGTDYRNTHPLVMLWLDKLCHLAGIQACQGASAQERIDVAFDEAYRQTRETEQVMPGTHGLFKQLSADEEATFRTYAQENSPDLAHWNIYHPVCRDEWTRSGMHP